MARKYLWIIPFIYLSFITSGSAQVDITGRVSGVVEDASGALVLGAKVSLAGAALMAPRSTTTQSDGGYLFDFVPIGTYQLVVEATGFKKFEQNDMQVSSGFAATVNPCLQVGGNQEVVEVPVSGPVVDVKNVATSTTFDESSLNNIPGGRDTWSTVAQLQGPR